MLYLFIKDFFALAQDRKKKSERDSSVLLGFIISRDIKKKKKKKKKTKPRRKTLQESPASTQSSYCTDMGKFRDITRRSRIDIRYYTHTWQTTTRNGSWAKRKRENQTKAWSGVNTVL